MEEPSQGQADTLSLNLQAQIEPIINHLAGPTDEYTNNEQDKAHFTSLRVEELFNSSERNKKIIAAPSQHSGSGSISVSHGSASIVRKLQTSLSRISSHSL
jgi:hypothetical protein